jgi:hypothetical protein
MRRSLYLIVAGAALVSSVTACTNRPATAGAGDAKPSAPAGTGTSAVSADTVPGASPSTSPSASTGGGTGGGSAGSGADRQPERCRTANLRASFTPYVPDMQAGSEHDARLGLFNVGDHSCVIDGHPGLQLIGADGKPRPTVVQHANTHKSFILKPGATAWSLIEWRHNPYTDEEDTSPLCGGKIIKLKIIPPGQTASLTVTAAMGTVCEHGEIGALPFQATPPTIG